jgi:REP element-mobilizing transposase RayT
MNFNPKEHHRQSLRLKGFDYSQPGAYFITICTQGHECLFGNIIDDEFVPNQPGEMVAEQWSNLSSRFPNLQLDESIVMPNHFHGIILITHPVGAPLVGAQKKDAPAVGDIIGAFKSITTNAYTLGVRDYNWPLFDRKLWQRIMTTLSAMNVNSTLSVSTSR